MEKGKKREAKLKLLSCGRLQVSIWGEHTGSVGGAPAQSLTPNILRFCFLQLC